jgi:hypothetical protein
MGNPSNPRSVPNTAISPKLGTEMSWFESGCDKNDTPPLPTKLAVVVVVVVVNNNPSCSNIVKASFKACRSSVMFLRSFG